jgi:hypothetical protein
MRVRRRRPGENRAQCRARGNLVVKRTIVDEDELDKRPMSSGTGLGKSLESREPVGGRDEAELAINSGTSLTRSGSGKSIARSHAARHVSAHVCVGCIGIIASGIEGRGRG